jgi:hypothetical protein
MDGDLKMSGIIDENGRQTKSFFYLSDLLNALYARIAELMAVQSKEQSEPNPIISPSDYADLKARCDYLEHENAFLREMVRQMLNYLTSESQK